MEGLAFSRVSFDFHSLLYSSYKRNPSSTSDFRKLIFVPSAQINGHRATSSRARSRQMSQLKSGTLVGSSIADLSSESIVDELKSKDWEIGDLRDELAATQGIRIRRRPPTGPPLHYVGPFEFRLQNEGNTPRNILEEIVWNKDVEVTQLKEKISISSLKKALESAPPSRDFIGALKASYVRTGFPGLIAEVKKASPSRGVLRENFDPVEIAKAYEKGGAACLSVLTDSKYFQGSFENLEAIRNAGVQCPLLCKEFIVDAWQLYYARTKGADAVLLIAAVLPDLDIKYMIQICKMIGLTALVEVHDEIEMDRMLAIDGIELIGINNRNLETFEVNISNTKKLLEGERGEKIRQKDIIVVGESGLFTPADIAYVQEAGATAGQKSPLSDLYQDPNPGQAAGSEVGNRASGPNESTVDRPFGIINSVEHVVIDCDNDEVNDSKISHKFARGPHQVFRLYLHKKMELFNRLPPVVMIVMMVMLILIVLVIYFSCTACLTISKSGSYNVEGHYNYGGRRQLAEKSMPPPPKNATSLLPAASISTSAQSLDACSSCTYKDRCLTDKYCQNKCKPECGKEG